MKRISTSETKETREQTSSNLVYSPLYATILATTIVAILTGAIIYVGAGMPRETQHRLPRRSRSNLLPGQQVFEA